MSTAITEEIQINDDMDFRYDIEIEYWPTMAVAFASYEGTVIADTTLNKILQPMGDNDREWEMYEERLSEWKDEAKTNLLPEAKRYINNI